MTDKEKQIQRRIDRFKKSFSKDTGMKLLIIPFYSKNKDERIIKSIHEIVIETLNVDPATRNRKGPIVIARQIFCKITKDLGYTYTYLARYLNKDHSTLIHAYNKAEELIYIKDTMFTEKYEQVIREINDKRRI
jgi:chromosomal replication initiation ATPase DnaA